LFSINPEHEISKQLLGVIAYATFTTITAFIIFAVIKGTIGLRVDADEELEGLDAGEHAMHAYDFLASAGRASRSDPRDAGDVRGGRMGHSPAE
jgi:ammonia channel protein AmtB